MHRHITKVHSHINRFNDWLALHITNGVGNMWCAYLFSLLALLSLPDAIKGGIATLITWIAQTFIQLVLLSIIMVGQKVSSKASDRRAEKTYKDCEEILKEVKFLQAHVFDLKHEINPKTKTIK